MTPSESRFVEILSRVHLYCFLLSYIAAFGVELFQLLRNRSALTRGLLIASTTAGLMAHAAYLVARSSKSGLPPLVGSSHDWLLVLAWLGVVFYLLILTTQRRITLGLFLLPVIVGLIVMSTFVDSGTTEEAGRLASRRWGMLHASTLVVGIGCVAAATLCALMYLLQHQKLRGKSSWLHRLQLPNLEKLTSVNRWLVIGTVAMLTVGLATGFILAATTAKGEFDWTDPIIAGTTIVWGIMTITLAWLLTQKEQTGRQVARMTLLAGGFLLLTVFGLMLLSGGVHENRPANSNKDAASLSEESTAGDAGSLICNSDFPPYCEGMPS